MGISALLVIVAAVLLILAAFEVLSTRVHLGWLGLALWAISTVVAR